MPRLLVPACLCALAAARRPQPESTDLLQKEGWGAPLNAYAIGQGFEGSASDWTEYLVWTVGVAALVFYFSGAWNKIDVYNLDAEPAATHAREPDEVVVAPLENLEDAALVEELQAVVTATVRAANARGELSRRYSPAELEPILARFRDFAAHLGTRRVYVASIDGVVVGCGMLTLDGNEMDEVRQMTVLPEYQGRGAGTALLRAILAFARQGYKRRLYLECPPGRRDWYAKFGFVSCAPEASATAAEFPGANARAPMELVL